MILIDPHAHSSEISACCKISGEEAVDTAIAAGLDGFILTNHYLEGYVNPNRHPTHEAMARAHVAEYEKVREYGDKKGFRVFFGLEISAFWDRSVHLLAYGVTEDFALRHARICQYSLEEIYGAVQAAGGILIQAHPYRQGRRLQDLRYLDGVEMSCHPHLHYGGPLVAEMLEIAEKNGKLLTCGGDYHGDTDYRPECGIYLPDSVSDSKDFAKYLRAAETVSYRVHEHGGEIHTVEYGRKEGLK